MIVREVFDNGVRLITETMDHVRSVSVGVWLTRGSRHEPIEHGGIAHFVEHMLFKGTGLRSAEDIAQLLKNAAKRPIIAEITSTPEYEYRSNRRVHHLVNSNRLTRYGQLDVLCGKTGFISSAGYCVATWVRQGSRDLITVVLGAPSNPARFNETRRVLDDYQAHMGEAATLNPVIPGSN